MRYRSLAARYEALAADMRAKVGPALPVPVDQLAGAFGLRIVPASLPSRVSGALFRYPAHAVIVYNRWMRETRVRFTLAHELGHWALHHHARATECHGGPCDPLEREADAFAAALLMPADAVMYWWRRGEAFTALCARFGVSYEAMHWRLIELGLV